MKKTNCKTKDECEIIADEIMGKLKKVCINNNITIENLLSVGINIFADTIKNS